MAHPEADQQKLFFEFLGTIEDRCFQARLVFAVPNGSNLAGGPRAGKWMKDLGLKPGVPDILCPYPSILAPESCGLAIEMKVKGGKTTPAQDEWLHRLQLVGWQTVICYSAVGAFNAWANYSKVDARDVELVHQSIPYQVALIDLQEKK
jgi:hypothetical protein